METVGDFIDIKVQEYSALIDALDGKGREQACDIILREVALNQYKWEVIEEKIKEHRDTGSGR